MKALTRISKQIFELVAPPPDSTVSQWADAERRLSSESSAEPGRWRTDRAPYQKAILDAVNDSAVKRVVIMSSAQIGKTEIINNIVGYYIDNDPSPILLLQPTLEMAQAYSKDRLAPMVRDTPCLASKISDAKTRSAGNTMLHKVFPGGHITMAGANSPASLASRPIRILLCDEIDRYPASAGAEGDPVNLAVKRTTTFWNRKIIMVSTPTVKDLSRIELAYNDSTQEKYNLKCKSCGEYQQIRRKHLQHTFTDDKLTKVTAHCERCGAFHTESEWKDSQGKWVAAAEHSHTRGFHLNEYVSPWRKWLEIELEFIEAKKSTETLKTFINTSLGETWEEQGESVDPTGLMARLEEYDKPEGVLVTTVGIDIQKDRIELEHVGWGIGEESWSLNYVIIQGDTTHSETWDDLQDVLGMLNPDAVGIDGGYNTKFVRAFVNKNSGFCYEVKGDGRQGVDLVEHIKVRRGKLRTRKRRGSITEMVGVNQAKAIIYSRLKMQEHGKGYCHFPSKPEYDAEYFAQLTGEKLVTRFDKGRPIHVWVTKRARQEALDCRVYALAVLQLHIQDKNVDFEKLYHNKKRPDIALQMPKKETRRKSGYWN